MPEFIEDSVSTAMDYSRVMCSLVQLQRTSHNPGEDSEETGTKELITQCLCKAVLFFLESKNTSFWTVLTYSHSAYCLLILKHCFCKRCCLKYTRNLKCKYRSLGYSVFPEVGWIQEQIWIQELNSECLRSYALQFRNTDSIMRKR